MLRPLVTPSRLAVLLLLPALSMLRPPAPEDACAGGDGAAIREAFLEHVNKERTDRRLEPLRLAPALCALAQKRAQEIVEQDDPEFDPLSGHELIERAGKSGYEARVVLELVVQAEGDIGSVVSSWQGTGARQAILHEGVRDLGVGYSRFQDQPLYVLLLGLSSGEFFDRKTSGLGDHGKLRREMLERVNRERKKARLPPLRQNPHLERAAQRHAEDMLARSFYGHETPEGRTPFRRALLAGYTPRSIAENIARGQFAVGEVMDGWMQSQVHRKNILNPFFSEVGFGFALGKNESGHAVFWVQVFGSPRR